MRNIKRITREDLDERNEYTGRDVESWQGSIEIAAGLGRVWFRALSATGYIRAGFGSGIKAGEGIKAGGYITAGEGIEAGWGIKAGGYIEAGRYITAGEGIKAGWDITAGEGIEAGWGITCTLTLSSPLRIFAGLCLYRLPGPEEMEVRCGKLVKGEVAYGTLVETGLPNEGPQDVPTMTVAGRTYRVSDIEAALAGITPNMEGEEG